MRQTSQKLTLSTSGTGFYEFTGELSKFVKQSKFGEGLLTVFVQHTSASLLIQENADPEVRRDFERFFRRLVPFGDALFQHTSEGPDDMPAHIRSALTCTSLSIPIVDGRLGLGTWQGIFLYEHRNSPHQRSIRLHIIGE